MVAFGRQPPGSARPPLQSPPPVLTPGYSPLRGQAGLTHGTCEVLWRRSSVTITGTLAKPSEMNWGLLPTAM